MSRKYKFHNPEGLYFVSFAVVYWIDLFVRDEYCQGLVGSLDYCQRVEFRDGGVLLLPDAKPYTLNF